MKVLVTGGAGFIGSYIVDELMARGHQVVVYDSLEEQVHGAAVTRGEAWPEYLNRNIRLIQGDVRDYNALKSCILDEQIEIVFHEAAVVGVGQSMYEIRRYVDVNSLGTANLLDILANHSHRVEKVIVASSMSIYGEGRYRCSTGDFFPTLRPESQLQKRQWEVLCPDGNIAAPLPTSETKPLFPTSIYATTKRDQEEMVLEFGEAYSIPTVALRYFNVFGPRQALSNPYTGVVAIFTSRLMNNRAPLIFEDGLQSRDFTHVSDIAHANILAMEKPEAAGQVFNVGTGRSTSLLALCSTLARVLSVDIQPEILGKYRAGDVRHCYADISKIRSALGFEPQVTLEAGLSELVEWLRTQTPQDHVDDAMKELEKRALAR